MNNRLLPALHLEHVHKNYGQVKVLEDATLQLFPGEVVALLGPSGSGKSTLLQIAGLLDSVSQGRVWYGNKDVTKLSEGARTVIRRNQLGFVYQFHHLLPEFTALENVMLPLWIAGVADKEAEQRAHEELVQLGLKARLTHRPGALSGGEQQRVAIARALVNKPKILLADEPTGNLDPDTAAHVGELLIAAAKRHQTATLIVTHNHQFATRMHRTICLEHSKVVPLTPVG